MNSEASVQSHESIVNGLPHDVVVSNIWPRIAGHLWDVNRGTPQTEARLRVGSMLAVREVSAEWRAMADGSLEGAALRACMIYAHRFSRGDRMQYLRLHLQEMLKLLGNSGEITVEYDRALVGDIGSLSNRELFELVRLLRRVKRGCSLFLLLWSYSSSLWVLCGSSSCSQFVGSYVVIVTLYAPFCKSQLA